MIVNTGTWKLANGTSSHLTLMMLIYKHRDKFKALGRLRTRRVSSRVAGGRSCKEYMLNYAQKALLTGGTL